VQTAGLLVRTLGVPAQAASLLDAIGRKVMAIGRNDEKSNGKR
jgi:hypothetical protein